LSHSPEVLEAVEDGKLEFTAASFIAMAPASAVAGLQLEQEQAPMPGRQLAERVLQLRRNGRTTAAMTLQHVLRSLEHIDHLHIAAERDLVEQLVREAERLLSDSHSIST
jgi:hypothetical protein